MGDTDQQALTDDFDAVAKAGPTGGPTGNGGAVTDTGDLNAPSGSYEWILGVTAIDTRAEQLRSKMLEKMNTERGEMETRLSTAARAEVMAKKGVEDAQAEATHARKQADDSRTAAADLEKQADDALLDNKVAEAQELREDAAMARAASERLTSDAAKAEAAAAELQKQAEAHSADVAAAHKQLDAQKVEIQAAEKAIDALEAKSGHLWSVDSYRTSAATLEQQAAELRAAGKTTEADAKTAEAAKLRADADASQQAADAVVIDETALATLGADAPTTPSTPSAPAAETPSAGGDGSAPATADGGTGAGGTGDATGATTGTATDDVGARAQALRAELQEKYKDPELSKRRDDLTQDKEMAEAAATAADANAARRQANHDRYVAEADKAEKQAADLERQGKGPEAEELREGAVDLRAAAVRDAELARQATAAAQEHRAEADVIGQQLESVQQEWDQRQAELIEADKAVDALEDKARHLDEAEAHDARAVELQREGEALRDQGKVKDAYLKDRAAEREVEAADKARSAAEAIKVDEAALTDAGLGSGAPTAPTTTTAAAVSAETAALEAYASQAREGLLEKQRVDRATELSQVNEAKRAETVAQKALETAEADVTLARTAQQEWLDRAKEHDDLAAGAEARGDAGGAREMREEAETYRASAARDQRVAEQAEAAVAAAKADVEAKTESRKTLEEKWTATGKELSAAENAIDSVEQKAAFLREADTQRARATELEAEARTLRAQGNDAAAAVRERQAVRATESATTAQTAAQLVQVDEAALTAVGFQPIPVVAPTEAGRDETTTPTEQQPAPADDAEPSGTPAASTDAEVEELVTAGATDSAADAGTATTDGTTQDGTAAQAEVDVTGAAQVTAAADTAAPPDNGVGTEAGTEPVGGTDAPAVDESQPVEPTPEATTETFEPAPAVAETPTFEPEPSYDEPDQTFQPEPEPVADAGEPPATEDASV